ncbi:MAG: cytidylate kinase-like family protein [Bacteroidales bacterium]|nr:cytidylate kinase-like family protein [Bacteroidales bacterium]MBK9357156.1 cytidylate kinase-like family protein [Bacteroidales bacterium]
MENLLLKLMAESFDRKQTGITRPGGTQPFITISREFGCQANLLAEMLKKELDINGKSWRIMNKEIIFDAARELNMDPEIINNISGAIDRTQFDEIMSALSSKYYKSDRKIRQTVASVVSNAAQSGQVIIVGRGGAAITHGLVPAIHIHLIAPIEWRLNSLMQRHNLKREEAFKQLTEIDHKRYKIFRDYVKWAEPIEQLFDLTFNCSTVTHNEMVGMIMNLVSERKMV